MTGLRTKKCAVFDGGPEDPKCLSASLKDRENIDESKGHGNLLTSLNDLNVYRLA